MNALTLEVILRVVFGVTDEARLERLRPLVRDLVDVSPLVFLGYAVPRLRSVGMWRRAAERTAALDVLVREEIRERRASPDLEHRADVLSRLIRVDDGGDRLTDDELRDQLVTLLLAGHETTATALAWTLHEIGLDPALRARARAAARTGDDDLLEALVQEAMRLHPVIPMVVRVLRRRPPSADSTCRPARRSRPRSCSPTRGPRATRTPASSAPSASSAASPPRTPGSPSAARGAALHRRRVLADGGGRGAARGAPGPRRRVPRARAAVVPQHHERAAPGRPHRRALSRGTARPPLTSHGRASRSATMDP